MSASPKVTLRRQIRVRLGRQLIAALLDLPEDVLVDRLIPTNDPGSVDVLLHSDRFDEVPEYAETPIHPGGIYMTRIEDGDGASYWRLEVKV